MSNTFRYPFPKIGRFLAIVTLIIILVLQYQYQQELKQSIERCVIHDTIYIPNIESGVLKQIK